MQREIEEERTRGSEEGGGRDKGEKWRRERVEWEEELTGEEKNRKEGDRRANPEDPNSDSHQNLCR